MSLRAIIWVSIGYVAVRLVMSDLFSLLLIYNSSYLTHCFIGALHIFKVN